MTRFKFLLPAIFLSLALLMPTAASGTKLPPGPLWHVSHANKIFWSCLLMKESTSTFSHINLGDNNEDGSSGVFQIEQDTWAAHQLEVHIPLSIHVWQATPSQQERVAFVIQRDNGWQPWSGDGCVYP